MLVGLVQPWREACREAAVSAMGERLLILEETADALDVIDPELAVHFRVVNGLPRDPWKDMAAGPGSAPLESPAGSPRRHQMRMDVGEDQIRTECSCGEWTDAVGWDRINEMVTRIRHHVGSAPVSGDDGVLALEPSDSRPAVEKWAG
jgi:hypothetical protein